MSELQQLKDGKIVSIIRGVKGKDVLPIAHALYQGGVRAIEITLNTPGALDAIAMLSQEMKGRMLVGAGTVLSSEDAINSINAGARFIISPGTDVPTIRTTKDHGAISIPGAFTATEIMMAGRSGADIVKVFPASSPSYFRELQGPLSHIPMMPTGGINLTNIREYRDAGAIAFGIGGSLVNPKVEMSEEALNSLSTNATLLIEAINQP